MDEVTSMTMIAGPHKERSHSYCKKQGEMKTFSYKKLQYDQSTQRLELEARQLLGPWHFNMLDLHGRPLEPRGQPLGFFMYTLAFLPGLNKTFLCCIFCLIIVYISSQFWLVLNFNLLKATHSLTQCTSAPIANNLCLCVSPNAKSCE